MTTPSGATDWQAQKALDEIAAANPQPGDHWHEMYSFHIIVVLRDGDLVVTADAPGGATLPRDAEWRVQTVAEFSKRVHYDSNPKLGCWVNLARRGSDTSWSGSRGSVLRRVASFKRTKAA